VQITSIPKQSNVREAAEKDFVSKILKDLRADCKTQEQLGILQVKIK